MKNKSFILIRNFTALLFAVALPLSVNAQQIGVDEAQHIAAEFFAKGLQHSSKVRHVQMSVSDPVLAYTAKTQDVADFYVFNNGNLSSGFVIVAGNHEQPDILGYSLEGTFDMESAPENFKWWIEQYQQNGITKRKVTKKFWHSVEPLIKTRWGQEEPFNSAIPHLEGYQSFVTGCTATAIAQVMNYYQYPKRGKGSNSYSITYNGDDALKVTFSADFGSTRYDWNNMLDDYSNGYTQAQVDAVATLMYHVGVAENISYSNSSYGSSAAMHHGAVAMREYFDYDLSMQTADREHFTDDEWEELIYQELEKGHPILYSGYSSSNKSGGHGFIVHGYDAEKGMYAINWGWKGHYDGYYSLASSTSLRPKDEVSYNSNVYNYGQTIYLNIKPNEGGQQVPIISTYDKVLMAPVSSSSAIQNYNLNRSTDEDIMLKLQFTPWNSGLCRVSFQYGLMFINRDNGHIIYPEEKNVQNSPEMGVNTKYADSKRLSFSTSLFQYNGVYEAWPAFSVDNGNTWQPMRTSVTSGVPTITVTGGKNMAKTTYTLTYLVDGDVYDRLELEAGTQIPLQAAPFMEGYTFSGWSLIPETMPAHNVTITGVFTFVDAIEDVLADDGEYQIYTLDGKPVETLQKGVNIIKYMNGKVKKVVVK